ncbi:MAG: M48 family metallopeptidase [Acidobacteriota bacterium]
MKSSKKVLSVFVLNIFLLTIFQPIGFSAQTPIKDHKNSYPPSEDVKLGRQAATEVEKQLPLLNDREVDAYIAGLGGRIVASLPGKYQFSEFRYSYKVVNVKDLNAFALPGGYTYVNRGLIEAAKNEGELIGVMAHEISHVALRHGTLQYAKGKKVGTWATIAAIGGLIVGGEALGSAIYSGFGVYFLKFSREYEKEADLLGAQTMARAGYDPRDLANMFKTLEQQGGKGGPEFLSDHPNPGNRFEYINREAEMLQVRDSNVSNRDFLRIREKLSGMGRARSMEEVSKGTRAPASSRSRPGDPPSRSLKSYTDQRGTVRVNYPDNWDAYASQDSVSFAPAWAIEGTDITRGAIVGTYVPNARKRGYLTLDQALNKVVAMLQENNNYLREEGDRRSERLSGKTALGTFLRGTNHAGDSERVYVVARQSGDNIVYMVFISPEREFRQYEPAFNSMLSSYTINERLR